MYHWQWWLYRKIAKRLCFVNNTFSYFATEFFFFFWEINWWNILPKCSHRCTWVRVSVYTWKRVFVKQQSTLLGNAHGFTEWRYNTILMMTDIPRWSLYLIHGIKIAENAWRTDFFFTTWCRITIWNTPV